MTMPTDPCATYDDLPEIVAWVENFVRRHHDQYTARMLNAGLDPVADDPIFRPADWQHPSRRVSA